LSYLPICRDQKLVSYVTVDLKPRDTYNIMITLFIMILTPIHLLILQGTTVAETSADATAEEGATADSTTVDSPTSVAGMYT
jgi:hypothetical protein